MWEVYKAFRNPGFPPFILVTSCDLKQIHHKFVKLFFIHIYCVQILEALAIITKCSLINVLPFFCRPDYYTLFKTFISNSLIFKINNREHRGRKQTLWSNIEKKKCNSILKKFFLNLNSCKNVLYDLKVFANYDYKHACGIRYNSLVKYLTL